MNIPETFFSVSEQLLLFGLSCLFGAVLGIVYDIFRALRAALPHNSWLVVFEDLIFLTFYAFFLSVFSSAAARGELRFYYVLGNLLGFMLYILTVGNAVISAVRKIFSVLRKLFSFIISPFCRCYVFLREKAAGKFVGSNKHLVNCLKNIRNLLLNCRYLLYNNIEIKKKERENRCRKK